MIHNQKTQLKPKEESAEVYDERGDPYDSAIEWKALEWIRKTLTLEVSHHEPVGKYHNHVHGPNQSSSSFANPERYNEKRKRLHSNIRL